MENVKTLSEILEWKIRMPDGTSRMLEPERGLASKARQKIERLIIRLVIKVWKFLSESWHIGVADPKKFVHCLKVGFALSAVSVFYYIRPLYESVGGNAMWAIMSVVVVFEYTVGATIYKSFNRAMATTLAGSLGVGIHWIAGHCGHEYEPIVHGVFLFLFASAVTFSRFIPVVKAKFDYGASIFILTFSLVSLSGYRVDKLLAMASQRVSTIAIGTSLCILTSMLIWPAWAGSQLHNQTISNLQKLASSLEGRTRITGCVAEYFRNVETADISEEELTKNLQGYKCVLNSKATEEAMANFARWEPGHGHFYFGYPWQQYLKIGAAARNCAYCIDSLNCCIYSEIQAPELLKQHIKKYCIRLSFCSSEVLKELATTIKNSRRSSKINSTVFQMNLAVEDLQDALKALPYFNVLITTEENSTEENNLDEEKTSVLEVLPLGTMMTLLIEAVGRIEDVVQAVDKLVSMAEWKTVKEQVSPAKQPRETAERKNQDHEEMRPIEKVRVLDTLASNI